MSFLTQAFLLERYGPRLSTAQLAECLGLAEGTVRNRISSGRLPVPTYLDNGSRWADYRDVSQYLDECRSRAASQAATAYTDAGSASRRGRSPAQPARS